MKFWKQTLIAISLVLSSSANAVVVNTLNGIDYEWLELTETAGLSRDEVEAMLIDENSALYGYQYASRQQVRDLFLSYSTWDGLSGWHTDNTVVSGAVSFLSDFGDLPVVDIGERSVTSVDGITVKYDSRLAATAHLGAPENCNTRSCYAQMQVLLHQGEYVAATQSGATGWDADVMSRDFVTFQGNEGVGSYLVRTTVVPVPAAVWLFGSGLIGLAALARRKEV